MQDERAWLERLRLRRGRSQHQIAAEIGISRSHWQDLASGRVEPKLGTARRVAAALGVTVDEAWPPEQPR
jgi:transcriptional regulator with XRE-family HTH domain